MYKRGKRIFSSHFSLMPQRVAKRAKEEAGRLPDLLGQRIESRGRIKGWEIKMSLRRDCNGEAGNRLQTGQKKEEKSLGFGVSLQRLLSLAPTGSPTCALIIFSLSATRAFWSIVFILLQVNWFKLVSKFMVASVLWSHCPMKPSNWFQHRGTRTFECSSLYLTSTSSIR